MVATRRSHSLDSVAVKTEAASVGKARLDTKKARSSSVKRSTTRQNAAAMECGDADVPVRHSARLRGEPLNTSENVRQSKQSNRCLRDEFDWNSLRSSKRLAIKKGYDIEDDEIQTSSRDASYVGGTRRSSRRRRADFDEEDTYLQFAAETLAPPKLLRRRSIQQAEITNDDGNEMLSQKKGKTRSELRDLLAAQGKNLSDVKAYTEPDIYSSVKSRVRASTRTRLYEEFYTGSSSRQKRQVDAGEEEEGSQSEETEEEEDDEDGNSNEDQEETEEDEEEEEEEEEDEGHPYRLRKVREAPQRYTIVRDVQRRRQRSLFEELPSSPVHRRRKKTSRSSGGGPFRRRRRRATAQGNSSTSSEDSSSDDEMKFRKRQQKSMARARNQCLPINMSSADISKHSFARDRKKIGGSLADIDPMALDTSVTFSSVGGHNKHIRALKEMVVFPLMYPEVFEKFSIAPPRGCLFYGPPGTGKTLMARALANECSTDGKRVSFFMKKGADCLSKWIGESERQLRVLFDQAYQMRPSIIFFDEIDGLAPVRSSRQDQIHSSIVSTLLALMDGLDGRGEVIVIGATNRIDSIDPALRRPGRFDREFLFPLPDKQAREAILQIHTKAWNPQLKQSFIDYLAAKTVGYCGADLKALCTEAALFALRRRYPQIYESTEKLQLNVGSIKITATDFQGAVKNIIPTAQRSVSNPGRALSSTIKPLMHKYLQTAVLQLFKLFPVLKGKSKLIQEIRALEPIGQSTSTSDRLSDGESDNELGVSMGGIYVGEPDGTSHLNSILPLLSGNNNGIVQSQYCSLLERLSSTEHSLSSVHRPRFIVCGDSSTGHTSHLTPALLHDMEGIPIHCIDLPALYGISARSPEESCAQVFREARRLTPSIIFLPNAQQWWNVAPHTVQATFESLLQDIPPHLPVLLLATANCSYRQLPRGFAKFFHSDFSEVYEMDVNFTVEERREFFASIFLIHAITPPTRSKKHSASQEVLAKAPAPEPAPLTQEEEKKIEKEEESTFRNLRLFLRDVLMRLGSDRRFKIFCKPVDFEEVPDYIDVIKDPMDFSTMHTKIDQHKYQTVAMFIEDIELICSNALEYNPDRRPEDKLIRHRACAMRDMAHAIVDTDLDPEFERLCIEIVESRKRRGISMNKFAPKYYPVLPKHLMVDPITGELTSKPDNELNGNLQSNDTMQPNTGEIVEKTPYKPPIPRTTSTCRSKRKRSSWSRGILTRPSRKKKKVVKIEDSGDEVEKKNIADNVEDNTLEQNGEISSEDDNDDSNDVGESGKQEKDDLEEYITPLEDSFENSTAMNIDIERDSNKDSSKEQDNFLKSDVEDSHVITNGLGLDEVPQDEIEAACSLEEDQHMGDDDVSRNSVILKTDNDKDENDMQDPTEVQTDQKVEGAEGDQHDEALKIQDNSGVAPTPPRKMTLRSRDRSISESNGVSKQETYEPPPPPFIVDHRKLMHLLEEVVTVTDSYTVEKLERVHSSLSRCVEKHKNSYDRTTLTQELEKEIHALPPHLERHQM